MPLSGQAMLITLMDADPAEERNFNQWYDNEHIIERVSIPGFLEARRYIAVAAEPKYLNFYTTETLDALRSPAYLQALRNPTAWTQHHMPKFRNFTRAAARSRSAGSALPTPTRPRCGKPSRRNSMRCSIGSSRRISWNPIPSCRSRPMPPRRISARATGTLSWKGRTRNPCGSLATSDSDETPSCRAPKRSRSAAIGCCGIWRRPSSIANCCPAACVRANSSRSDKPSRCAAPFPRHSRGR